MNLLLLNDVQEIEKWKLKEIAAGLYNKKLSKPLLIFAVYFRDRMKQYGVGGFPDFKKEGSKALSNFQLGLFKKIKTST